MCLCIFGVSMTRQGVDNEDSNRMPDCIKWWLSREFYCCNLLDCCLLSARFRVWVCDSTVHFLCVYVFCFVLMLFKKGKKLYIFFLSVFYKIIQCWDCCLYWDCPKKMNFSPSHFECQLSKHLLIFCYCACLFFLLLWVVWGCADLVISGPS